MNKNSTWMWRITILTLISVGAFFCSWAFGKLETMDSVYAQKTEVQNLSEKMDHGFEKTYEKIDEINKYLRE